MAKWLQILRANTNSTEDPLKITRITYDKKFEAMAVEVPMSYDLLKKHDFLGRKGKFNLILNGGILLTYCERATNGTCLLGFDKNLLRPGTNQIQVVFYITKMDNPLIATGPVTEFVSSNVCQVNSHVFLDRNGMVVLWADLSVSNAVYSIELLHTNGNLIKTITGRTTNGTINERWNLTDDAGNIYPLGSFEAVYHVAIPNSVSEMRTQVHKLGHP